jgi:hypothetical protein
MKAVAVVDVNLLVRGALSARGRQPCAHHRFVAASHLWYTVLQTAGD